MTTRLLAGVLLAASLTTGATVLAAGDQWTHDDIRDETRHLGREVGRAVRESLREARHEIRAAMREVHRAVREHREHASHDWQSSRVERDAARERAREARSRARDLRERDRDTRAFRQVSPTDDPCERNRGNGDRGHACEVRDTRLGAPGSPLSVDASPNGGIRVEGWDQPDVLVRAVVQTWGDTDAEARDVLTQVRVNAAGARVTAEGPERTDGQRGRGWSVSYRIWAPRQTALDLVAHNGGVSVHAMQSETRFTTVNGGVTLDDVSGRVAGRTANGGVNVRLSGARWEGAGLDVETTNGGVSLTLPRDYSAALEVSTVNGGLRSDIPVTLPDGRRHEIRTTLGSGGPLLKVRTVNGGVKLIAR